MENLVIFKKNKIEVRRRLKEGRVDYIDSTSWSFIDRFFAFLMDEKFFDECSILFPSPRKRKNIPVWFLLSCVIQMKLFTTAAYNKLGFVLRSGSILNRVGFNVGLKDGGFNHRNKKKRICPVDQDTVRKFFTGAPAMDIIKWYNRSVVRWYKAHRAFRDKQGVFILDTTLIPTPGNPNYKNTALLPLDKDGRYVNVEKLSADDRKKFKYTRAYKLSMLLSISGEDDHFIFAAAHLGPGDESGLIRGKELIDNFVKETASGTIKLLIADREYIDAEMINRAKLDHGIDILIPLRYNMEALKDAIGLSKLDDEKWMPCTEEKDSYGRVIKKEEVMGIRGIKSWEGCKVPLNIILVREINASGKENIWALATTRLFKDPRIARRLYSRRMQIEERIDQIKNCWWVGSFTTPNFNADVVHVFFVLLTYSLIQLYLKATHNEEFATKTFNTLREDERMGKDGIIVYTAGDFAIFDWDEYTDIILNLKKDARVRLSRWLKAYQKRKLKPP